MLTQNDLPQQFQAVKDEDENIIWVGEPRFFPFLCTGIPFLAIGLLWGAIDYFGFIRPMGGANSSEPLGFIVPFFALHLFPFWGSILNMFRLVLVHKNTFYAITNKRVMMRSGFWGIDFNAVDYDKISDVQVTVNPLENMLGVGTVRISAGKVDSKGNSLTEDFIAVENPYEVFKQLKTVMVNIKTDWNYPNKLRPDENPGYKTKYNPK
ncbi:MAG: PH domain-containing protein [Elusimicrobia bacterium]|nr:PH domain-containing protein [Elusimicrobiota bacterium]